jgi:hypothetical protein
MGNNIFFSVDFSFVENGAILLFLSGVAREEDSDVGKILAEKLKDCAEFHLLHSGYNFFFLGGAGCNPFCISSFLALLFF